MAKRKRVKGLGGTLWKQLEPLNSIEFFKNKYKDAHITLVINATDGKWAAVIKIDNGVLDVEAIDNSQNLKKMYKEQGWSAMVSTTTNILFNIVAGKISKGGMVKKVLTRKIKVKGAKNLRVLESLFNILEKEKEKAPAEPTQ